MYIHNVFDLSLTFFGEWNFVLFSNLFLSIDLALTKRKDQLLLVSLLMLLWALGQASKPRSSAGSYTREPLEGA